MKNSKIIKWAALPLTFSGMAANIKQLSALICGLIPCPLTISGLLIIAPLTVTSDTSKMII